MGSPSLALCESGAPDRLVSNKTREGRKVLTPYAIHEKGGAPAGRLQSAGEVCGGPAGYRASISSTAPTELSAVSRTGGSAAATPWCAIQRSASSAAMHPVPAAVIACRK